MQKHRCPLVSKINREKLKIRSSREQVALLNAQDPSDKDDEIHGLYIGYHKAHQNLIRYDIKTCAQYIRSMSMRQNRQYPKAGYDT